MVFTSNIFLFYFLPLVLLLYYALPSWYIRTTAVKDSLIKGNESINWYPEHVKEGRFGDWLAHNVD